MEPFMTMEMLVEGTNFALPSLKELCSRENYRYEGGPNGLVLVVKHIQVSIPVWLRVGELRNITQGDALARYSCDFEEIAEDKVDLAMEHGCPTSLILEQKPWLLVSGNTLYGGGVAEDSTFGVAASGLLEPADEAAAWCVFNFIAMLAKVKINHRKALGANNV